MDRVTKLAIAVNGAGSALLVWTGLQGLYASSYAPGTGWGSAQTVASGPPLFFDFADSFAVALDEAGRGLLAWSEPSDSVLSSTYDPNTLEWSPPVVVGDRGSEGTTLVTSLVMDMDASGNAVLAWAWLDITPGTGTLYAARFVQGQGWQAPDPLWSSAVRIPLFVAADEAGGAMAVWVELVAAFPETSVYASRYVPGQGWQTADLVSDAGYPDDPVVDVDADGNALVAWRTGFDKNVSARRYIVGAGWQGIEVLRHYSAGDPGPIQTNLFGQTNALVVWNSPSVPGTIEAQQYLSSTGWRPIDVLGARTKGGATGGLVAVNGSTACVTWIDNYDVAPAFDFFADVYATRLDLPVDPEPCDNPTTSTSSTSSTSSSTTTTPPQCTTARCELDDALGSSACAHDTLPTGIIRKLHHATEIIEAAPAVTGKKAVRLYRRARRLLTVASDRAQRASSRKRPRLSPECAITIRDATERVRGTLP
jgi:hypothetical protein